MPVTCPASLADHVGQPALSLPASRVPPSGLRRQPACEAAGYALWALRQPGADPFQAVVGRLDRLDRRMEQKAKILAERLI
jgi:hypothetical protein